ncbi:MAG: single-stranded-DNA-specific exonuclease RecJ [Flavobacteriaceae bacterium]
MRWTLKAQPEEEKVAYLANVLQVDRLVACLLLQRSIENYEEAKEFFRPQLSALHDPFLMKDMSEAVDRIQSAIKAGENILIYGDYDVDGTTAVSLLSSYLLEKYPNVATYIPDRYAEGYGVSVQGIDFAHDNDISLIIALDCGIKALEQVAYAKERGIDFIICDHHRPGEKLPDAVAILDPKREDDHYPYKELCGCGIGFKLIQALGGVWGEDMHDLMPYLDLVVVAIAADIVPITGENRILAHHGLEVINSRPRPGIKAITGFIDKKELSITDVVFIIAPRINAAGRMKHGLHAVELLMERNFEKAVNFASAIEAYNTERKGLDQRITAEALQQISDNKEEKRFTSVVYKEDWHKGVIGIVASRLIETYYRPTLVFTKSGDRLAASARSIKGFDLYNALQDCSDSLEQFGGHKYAAGLTLMEEQFEEFKQKFEGVVERTINPEILSPEIKVDAEIPLRCISPRLVRILKQFGPFGPGNSAVVFLAIKLKDTGYARTVGTEKKHLKLSITQGDGSVFPAIGFNLGHKLRNVAKGQFFDAVFTIEENEWNGKKSIQLKIKDLR